MNIHMPQISLIQFNELLILLITYMFSVQLMLSPLLRHACSLLNSSRPRIHGFQHGWDESEGNFSLYLLDILCKPTGNLPLEKSEQGCGGGISTSGSCGRIGSSVRVMNSSTIWLGQAGDQVKCGCSGDREKADGSMSSLSIIDHQPPFYPQQIINGSKSNI